MWATVGTPNKYSRPPMGHRLKYLCPWAVLTKTPDLLPTLPLSLQKKPLLLHKSPPPKALWVPQRPLGSPKKLFSPWAGPQPSVSLLEHGTCLLHISTEGPSAPEKRLFCLGKRFFGLSSLKDRPFRAIWLFMALGRSTNALSPWIFKSPRHVMDCSGDNEATRTSALWLRSPGPFF